MAKDKPLKRAQLELPPDREPLSGFTKYRFTITACTAAFQAGEDDEIAQILHDLSDIFSGCADHDCYPKKIFDSQGKECGIIEVLY